MEDWYAFEAFLNENDPFGHLLSNHNCFSFLKLKLPESGKYDVELIDTWEMTRKIVMSGVSSKIKVMLPGKEGTSKKGIS